MAKYQWYSQKLKQRASNFDWLTIGALVVACVCLKFVSVQATIGVAILAIVFQVLSMRVKKRDKQLKSESEPLKQ